MNRTMLIALFVLTLLVFAGSIFVCVVEPDVNSILISMILLGIAIYFGSQIFRKK